MSSFSSVYRWYSDDLSRLGESAVGDGVSGHFPVSFVDPVSGPSPLSPFPHLHLDLQMAHCSHHAGGCEYFTKYIQRVCCICVVTKTRELSHSDRKWQKIAVRSFLDEFFAYNLLEQLFNLSNTIKNLLIGLYLLPPAPWLTFPVVKSCTDTDYLSVLEEADIINSSRKACTVHTHTWMHPASHNGEMKPFCNGIILRDIPVFVLLILDRYFWWGVFAIKLCQYLEIQPKYMVS